MTTASLVAGTAFGTAASVRTHSPMFYIHWELAAGARVELPGDHRERAAYVVTGAVDIEGQTLGARPFSCPRSRQFSRRTTAPSFAIGEPLGARFIEWNFVSSSRERIEQAKADWRAGRMKLPDLDDQESILLPPERSPPANPMS